MLTATASASGKNRLPDLRIRNVGFDVPEVGETQQRRPVVADGSVPTNQWLISIRINVLPDDAVPRLFIPDMADR